MRDLKLVLILKKLKLLVLKELKPGRGARQAEPVKIRGQNLAKSFPKNSTFLKIGGPTSGPHFLREIENFGKLLAIVWPRKLDLSLKLFRTGR